MNSRRSRQSRALPNDPVYNDPIFIRRLNRIQSRPYRLKVIITALHSILNWICLFLWCTIGGYLTTVSSSGLAAFCPNCRYEWSLHVSLLLVGIYFWFCVILYRSWHILWLLLFTALLLVINWTYDQLFWRVKLVDLSNDELEYFNAFQHKMAAIGSCLVNLKLAMALLHVAAFLALLVMALNVLEWIVVPLFNKIYYLLY